MFHAKAGASAKLNAARPMRRGESGPPPPPSLPVLTSAPEISGALEAPATLTCSTGVWSGTRPITYAYQWFRDAVLIPGEDAATYNSTVADDEDALLSCVVTPTNSVGTGDPATSGDFGPVTAPVEPPSVVDVLADQTFTEDTGDQTYATAFAFAGDDLVYSLTSTVAGVTISAATGVITIDTDVAAVQELSSIVVRADNTEPTFAQTGFSLTIEEAAASGDAVVVLHLVGASNEQGGAEDDPAATRIAADTVANAYWVNIGDPDSTGLPVLRAVEQAQPYTRMGGAFSTTVNPAPALARELQAGYSGGTLHVLINTLGFGGQGVRAGTDNPIGPMNPSGAGPAFQVGGSAASAEVGGALYLYATDPGTVSAMDTLVSGSFPGLTRLPDIAFGKVANENDTEMPFPDFVSESITFIEDLRTAWGQPNMPFVFNSAPPPWSFSGVQAPPKVAGGVAAIAQQIPHAAYVEGPGEVANQHTNEPIHFSNPGYRLIGAAAHPVIAIAESRAAAPLSWVDWVDGLTEQPTKLYSLYRGLSTYTGPCITVDNGTSTTDISFLANGWLDTAALLNHAAAGTGDCWITVFHNQMGAGTMVAEGSGTALIVVANNMLFQGRRFAWGDDETNIMFTETGITGNAGGALLAVGRVSTSGNAVQADWDNRTLTLITRTGETDYYIGTDSGRLDTPLEYEPDFIQALSGSPKGYNLYASYLDASGLRVNGAARTDITVPGRTQAGLAGALCWGGRSTQTNRYSNGSHTALAVWDTAPAGADLDIVDAWCLAISATDDTWDVPGSGFSSAFSGDFG